MINVRSGLENSERGSFDYLGAGARPRVTASVDTPACSKKIEQVLGMEATQIGVEMSTVIIEFFRCRFVYEMMWLGSSSFQF